MVNVAESPSAVQSLHPLDPLSAGEYNRVHEILKEAGHLGEAVVIGFITLREPDKDAVLDGRDVPREAFVGAVDKASAVNYRAIVSISVGRVLSWEPVSAGTIPLAIDASGADAVIKAHPDWQAAMRKRGITDFENVQIDTWPAAHFGLEVEKGRRLIRGIAYAREDKSDNGYARPIDGVIAFTDLNGPEVVEVVDYGVSPIPAEKSNYDEESVVANIGPMRTDIKPLDIVQPEGPSFDVEGNLVRWQKWQFRVSMHAIHGLVLHQVGYEDQGRVRSILYRASLSEMVVPYGSTDPMSSWKNAFDAGEIGLGRLANALELGCDCLGTIHYFDCLMAGPDGKPYEKKNAICMHEEDFGILWKHFSHDAGQAEVRRSRRLVVSSIHTIGNYEYGFFWYFYQDGSLQMEVKLTGIMQTMAPGPNADLDHSVQIAPELYAPHHQHLFNFRLDFDVDGPQNTVYEVDVEREPAGPNNPLNNAFAARATPLTSESGAQRVVDTTKDRTWLITNPNVKNRLGKPVGYKLLPGATPTMLAGPDSSVAKRAAFATKNLWVTQFDRDELHAAGDFPNENPGGEGLPEYVAKNRPLENEDVVLWFTTGVTHIARPEDWPVMPVEYHGFLLKPIGFFDRNPALDVPPSHSDHCASDEHGDHEGHAEHSNGQHAGHNGHH